MIITATDRDIVAIATRAINASSAMGLGILHFKSKEYTEEEIATVLASSLSDGQFSLDYFEGRMVKLSMRRKVPQTTSKLGDEWLVPDVPPTADYQSWAVKYPTYEALAYAGLAEETP